MSATEMYWQTSSSMKPGALERASGHFVCCISRRSPDQADQTRRVSEHRRACLSNRRTQSIATLYISQSKAPIETNSAIVKRAEHHHPHHHQANKPTAVHPLSPRASIDMIPPFFPPENRKSIITDKNTVAGGNNQPASIIRLKSPPSPDYAHA